MKAYLSGEGGIFEFSPGPGVQGVNADVRVDGGPGVQESNADLRAARGEKHNFDFSPGPGVHGVSADLRAEGRDRRPRSERRLKG